MRKQLFSYRNAVVKGLGRQLIAERQVYYDQDVFPAHVKIIINQKFIGSNTTSGG